MAISKNFLLAGVTGGLGRQIVVRQRNGKTILSAYPDISHRKLSPKQLQVNEQMREANAYARSVQYNDEARIKAQIRLDVPRNKLYTSLIREFFQLRREEEPASPGQP